MGFSVAARVMRFRPCIDLHAGLVKQIVGSSLVEGQAPTENFVATKSPGEYAEMYQASGLPGGHIIMLGPGNEEAAMAAIKAYPGGMQIGGGINPSNAMTYLAAGASHIIVTSYVFVDGKFDMARLEEMVAAVTKEKLVLDLSCRLKEGKYYVVTDKWQKFTDFEVNKESLNMLADYCAEFLVHGVDVEGKMMGLEEELVRMLGQDCPIPVTYAGGSELMGDLDRVKAIGGGGVDLTIGSALDIFGGSLSYDAVVQWQRQQEADAGGDGAGFGRTYS